MEPSYSEWGAPAFVVPKKEKGRFRIITQKDAMELIGCLKGSGCGITNVDAQGAMGPVKIIFTIVKRKDIDRVLEIVRTCNPMAFFTIEDVRSVRKGVFPLTGTSSKKHGTSAAR